MTANVFAGLYVFLILLGMVLVIIWGSPYSCDMTSSLLRETRHARANARMAV